MRKIFALLLWVWLSLFSLSCSAAYSVSEEELTILENNLIKLEQINNQSQSRLANLRQELELSKSQSIKLNNQLTSLQESSKKQEKLLQNANQSLQEYEQEVKEIERQRAIAWCVAGIILLSALN